MFSKLQKLLWCLFFVLTAQAIAQDNGPYGSPDFVQCLIDDQPDNCISIIARGNWKDHKAYLTVFELVGDNRELRRLHEVELLNDFLPKDHFLFVGGRFLVTLDEYVPWEEMEHALGIYDLVRGERTSYRLKDIFDESDLNLFEEPGEFPYIDWHRVSDFPKENFFDRDTFTFNTCPPYVGQEADFRRDDDRENKSLKNYFLPNVVVDLRSRTFKVDRDRSKPRIMKEVSLPYQKWVWAFKKDDDHGREPGKVLLPRLIRCKFRDFTKTDLHDPRDRVYELDVTTKEYRIVPNEEWQKRIPRKYEKEDF